MSRSLAPALPAIVQHVMSSVILREKKRKQLAGAKHSVWIFLVVLLYSVAETWVDFLILLVRKIVLKSTFYGRKVARQESSGNNPPKTMVETCDRIPQKTPRHKIEKQKNTSSSSRWRRRCLLRASLASSCLTVAVGADRALPGWSHGWPSKNRGFTPQIIHLFIGFSIIFTLHFGSFPPLFLVQHTHLVRKIQTSSRQHAQRHSHTLVMISIIRITLS